MEETELEQFVTKIIGLDTHTWPIILHHLWSSILFQRRTP